MIVNAIAIGLTVREVIAYHTFPHLRLMQIYKLILHDLYDNMWIYYSIVEVISQAFGEG